MRVCQGIDQFEPPPAGTVVIIGNFDGVHLGHQRLVEVARRHAHGLSAPVVAVTFDPHPLAILAPQRAPARLTTLTEKLALLDALAVETTIVLRTDRELLDTTAEQFLVDLAERCRPRAIVEGPTFNFGRGREGGVETLRKHADRLGFGLTIVDELHCAEVAGRPAINSSTIRRALQAGHLADANAMLGRPYRIAGVVGRGQSRGAVLGFPTANLDEIPHLLPRPAVYVAAAQLAADTLHLSALNIGPQPTFDQPEVRVEAHLLDYTGELHGQRLGLHLLGQLRGQTTFRSPDELATQLRRDIAEARTYAPQVRRLRHEPLVPL
jgi:riboflavin kinase/FMN adenylyltransferase